MILKKELLIKPGLCLVTDRTICGNRNIVDIISGVIDSGVDMVQYRDKETADRIFMDTALKIKKVLTGKNIVFIINDRVDIALLLGADGIHLGQEDIPLASARKLLGKKRIIGLSAHSVREAIEAEKEGADYVSIGAIFPTPVKHNYNVVGLKTLRRVVKAVHIPVMAIGGIDESNIKEVVDAGAKRVAVVRAILADKRPPMAAERLIKAAGFQYEHNPLPCRFV